MIHISNAYKKAIYGRSDWYPSARVTFLDGTVLNLGRSEFLISGNNIVDGAGTQSLPLGNVVARKITVKLYNADDRYRVHSFLGAKITLYKSISTDIGDLTIKSGTYTVIDPESYGDTVSFSAYDDAYKLDRDYTTHLTYPLSLKDILKDSCRTCGVQMDVTSFSDDNIMVKEKPTNTTHRQVIGWIAMIAGGNAWMNADNHLQISQYDMSLFDNIADIDGGWFDDPRQNYDGGQFETDMISEKYSTYAEMSGGTFSEDISEYYYDDLDWSSEKYSSGSNVDGGWFDDGLELLTDDSYGIMYRSVERKQKNAYQLIGKKDNLFLLKNGNVLGVHSVDVEEASAERKKGNYVVEEPGKGFRRIVAAPNPVSIVEIDAIKALLDADQVVIACGGGGIPVLEQDHRLKGASAVIEKDLTAGKMAEETDADSLIILTSVEKVKINMDRPEEEELREISVDQAKAYMEEGHFGKYNMYPKFRAAVEFLEKREGRSALITSFDKLDEALKGKTGTLIR